MINHEKYMGKCLDLAKTGLRKAMPNPGVGAILLHDQDIIGEGHTQPYDGFTFARDMVHLDGNTIHGKIST